MRYDAVLYRVRYNAAFYTVRFDALLVEKCGIVQHLGLEGNLIGG